MATKKSPAKKTAASEPAVKTGPSEPAKAAAKKVPAKKSAAKTVDVQASGAESQAKAGAKTAEKQRPSHHDVSVQAYLLWERDGKKHGHQDQYWQQAEHDLLEH